MDLTHQRITEFSNDEIKNARTATAEYNETNKTSKEKKRTKNDNV